MKSEIIAVGSEMLTPFRQDTNSLYLTEKLNGIGVTVAFKTIVGDRRKDLVGAIRTALGRADILILMGGLGPTEDDLTREAVAEALSITLRRDASQVAALHARAATWRISDAAEQSEAGRRAARARRCCPTPMAARPANGSTQPSTAIASSSRCFPARRTSACRCSTRNACRACARLCLPRAIAVRTLKAAMIPESQADKLLAPVYTTYTRRRNHSSGSCRRSANHPCLLQGERSRRPRRAWMNSPNAWKRRLKTGSTRPQGESLEQIVLFYLGLRQATLAVAESCTGGMVAQRITAVPGASRSFLGGVVVYSDQLKTALADVPEELLAQHGAVSLK